MGGRQSTGANVTRLTPRQQAVLDFIAEHIAIRGYPPTTRELAVGCDLGTASAAHRMLGILERKGYVSRTPGAKRAITIEPPRVDPGRLAPFMLEIIATAMGWQDVAVERILEAARETRDPDVRSTLIQDALERHQITLQICRSLGIPGLPQWPGPAIEELQWFRQEVPWPYFVVDHLVYNRAVAIGTRPLQSEIPELTHLWEALRRSAERAARRSEAWFNELGITADPEQLVALQERAEHLLARMSRTALHFGRTPFADVKLPLHIHAR